MFRFPKLMRWRRTDAPGSKPPSGPAGGGIRVSPDELIQLRLRARSIPLDSRRQVAYATAGIHPSRFRGRGIDYQESRNYQPGDDIRAMDWRVTARTGRPHTKLYREERERPVIVMVDLGPSMFFGTRVAFKSVLAARAAALLGWATVHHGDRIGAFLFAGDGHQELRPTGGRHGVLKLIRALVAWTAPERGLAGAGSPSLGAALQRLRRVVRPGSLVFILSDFYSLDEDSDYHLTRLRQHNDLVACQIVDTLELAAPPPDRYAITDGQRSGILDIRSKALRERYEAYFAGHRQRVRRLALKRSIPLLLLATHEDVADSLRRGLANAAGGVPETP